jgi:hypothetical protein
VEYLKVVSILLPILVALSGAGLYVYGLISEPNFENGKYFTTAWIEYGVNQNTLNVEYVPTLKGAVFPAMREALQRLDAKADINKKIDGKPVLVVAYVRYKTQLVETSRVVITRKDVTIMETGSYEEKQALLHAIQERAESTYKLPRIMVEREDGRVEYVEVTNTTMNTTKIIDDYIARNGVEFYA